MIVSQFKMRENSWIEKVPGIIKNITITCGNYTYVKFNLIYVLTGTLRYVKLQYNDQIITSSK